MKTKKKPKLVVFDEPVIEDVKEEPEAMESGNGYRPGSKLSVSIKEDGSIDWDAMRPSTKEKVKQAFETSGFRSEPQNGHAQPEVQMFHPAMVSGLYDMLGAIEATMAQRYGHIPAPIAKQVFTYTNAEKEALSGPTIRVMNKYVADWMIKYQDEIALGTLLVSLTVAKVNAAISLSRMQTVQTAQTAPKPEDGPTPPTQVQ